MKDLPRWPDPQMRTLRDNRNLPLSKLMILVNAAGPRRTAEAVKHKRTRLNATLAPLTVPLGWPEMEGTPEERDERFVSTVLRAQLDAVRARANGSVERSIVAA